MLKELKAESVYIVCGYTDMRRSIDGLAAIVQQNLGLEPCSGSLFLFCGRKRDRLKALLWEGDGFLMMYKRLDNGAFPAQWVRSKTADIGAIYMADAGAVNRAAKGNKTY